MQLSGLGIVLQIGSILCQDTCLDGGLVPHLGTDKRQQMDVSLTHRRFPPSLSPSLPLSLKKK